MCTFNNFFNQKMRTGFIGRGRDRDQSALQKLHNEARVQLEQRNEQIAQLNKELEKAEEKLSSAKRKLNEIKSAAKEESNSEIYDDYSEIELKEIDAIKSKHQQDEQKLIEEYEDEAAKLETMYAKQLKEAEEYVDQHSQQVLLERQNELMNLQNDLQQLRENYNTVNLEHTKQKDVLIDESRGTSMTNTQKIQYLESQLTEVAAISREEMREIRAKINETMIAFEERQKDFQNQVKKYEAEYDRRNKQYEEHIGAIRQQYDSEKEKYKTKIETDEHNYNSLQRVVKQLEKQREKQLSTAIKDNETMKTTIYQAKTREAPSLQVTRTIMTQSHQYEQQCTNMIEEIKVIDEEIKDIMEENKELQAQLLKFERLKAVKIF